MKHSAALSIAGAGTLWGLIGLFVNLADHHPARDHCPAAYRPDHLAYRHTPVFYPPQRLVDVFRQRRNRTGLFQLVLLQCHRRRQPGYRGPAALYGAGVCDADVRDPVPRKTHKRKNRGPDPHLCRLRLYHRSLCRQSVRQQGNLSVRLGQRFRLCAVQHFRQARYQKIFCPHGQPLVFSLCLRLYPAPVRPGR